MTVLTEFWSSLEARDWDRFGGCVAEDVVCEWPQTRERVRGRDALVRFMREFPGDWHLALAEEHGLGATRVDFTSGGETVAGLTFFDVADGVITAIREWWPEAYAPPPGREHLVERY